MKPRPQWNVPITADMPHVTVTAVIRIADDGRVELTSDRPGGPLLVTSPMEAAQLGQALQDAAREAARRRR